MVISTSSALPKTLERFMPHKKLERCTKLLSTFSRTTNWRGTGQSSSKKNLEKQRGHYSSPKQVFSSHKAKHLQLNTFVFPKDNAGQFRKFEGLRIVLRAVIKRTLKFILKLPNFNGSTATTKRHINCSITLPLILKTV